MRAPDVLLPGLVGTSRAMRQVASLVRAAAATDITVLVEGETGTGKELIARAIATLGARRAQPFVAINCGALPESMLDAELFGHRHGAFTGAARDRRGLLESAHGGTVFLDEISSMSASFQARLLRVLENAEVRAVGCDQARRVDLRVVAASNVSLADVVRRGEFRADLFYRLRVFPVTLPPLRDRRDDIPLLIDAFLKGTSGMERAVSRRMSGEALAVLVRYHYPGNVRELKNEIARAAALAGGEEIAVEHLSPHVRGGTGWPHGDSDRTSDAGTLPTFERRRADAIADVERRLVFEALEHHAYNVSRAAAALAMSRFGLRKRMQRLGLCVRRSVVPAGTSTPGCGIAS